MAGQCPHTCVFCSGKPESLFLELPILFSAQDTWVAWLCVFLHSVLHRKVESVSMAAVEGVHGGSTIFPEK